MDKPALILVFLSTILLSSKITINGETTYKAAVLEHVFQPFSSTPLATMLSNANVYVDAIKRAAEWEALIIVFPEFGLVGFDTNFTEWQERLSGFYIFLPANADQWAPCLEPFKFDDGSGNHEVLRVLSCAAINSSIAILVNVLTKEPCDLNIDSNCPSDGFFKYNTNLIFGSNGTLLARYHKWHLFGEPFLNQPPEVEFVMVELGNVTFGTFICYDLMYADPAIEYITKFGIRNFLFSTAWGNELPFITAPQMFSRFARGLGVNLIVSNPYAPPFGRLGAGIYSSNLGALNETYDLSTPGRLIIAEIPIDPLPIHQEDFLCDLSAEELPPLITNVNSFPLNTTTDKPSSLPTNKTLHFWYQSLRNFSHQFLLTDEGNPTICQGDLCCHLEYTMTSRNNDTPYAFAILNGYHHMYGEKEPYIQVCSVLRCESDDIESCGRVPEKDTSVRFTRFSLMGNFAATTLLPSILGADLQLIPNADWTFTKGACAENHRNFTSGARISLVSMPEQPIMVASVYGRVFDRDL